MSKKYKSGLVLGKFMPLHFGHMFLITSAAKGCEKLTVLACSIKSEPIPGNLRYGWVKSFCNSYQEKNIKAINITEELPQLPEEHPQFWEIWCDLIKENCPDIDVIYTSEDYGFELAKRLGIKHELVDKERKKHPISGTKIRNNPYENWSQIYTPARSYFINRIYFLGPESTGKTTTSKNLSEEFDVNWVPEYGRILYEKKEGNLDYRDFYEIVIKQREIENSLVERTQEQVIFCDTDVITTKVFFKFYYPEYSLSNFFDYHIEQQLVNKCHFFVMSPEGTEFVQDGTRTVIPKEDRQMHFDEIIKELNKWNIPYTVLRGDYKERHSVVKKFVEKLVQEEVNW